MTGGPRAARAPSTTGHALEEHVEALPVTTPNRNVSTSRTSRTPSPRRFTKCTADTCDHGDTNAVCDMLLSQLYDDRQFEERRHVFYHAPRHPPISKQSMSELDIGSIINNSKLRHDVNFDRELHFRPNMDGDRGHKKRQAQNDYWTAISIELSLIYYILGSDQTMYPEAFLIENCSLRLRIMFQTLKDILKNLVPERDQSEVEEHIDVQMLMQSISHGVCDFVSIAQWMAQLLKRHCAPMRDDVVDSIVSRVQKQTPGEIAGGLAILFTVLEAMKLDVANHQIRHLRALLIEDTVNFERKYHHSRIQRRRYDCQAARRWYKRAQQEVVRVPIAESYPNRDVESFLKGFLRLLLPTTKRLPDTFALDADRIAQLQDDLDEIIAENICCDVLKEIVTRHRAILTKERQIEFRERLHVISEYPRTPVWHRHYVDDIACQIVRSTLLAMGSSSVTDVALEEEAYSLLDKRLRALFQARRSTGSASDQEESKWIEGYNEDLYNQVFGDAFHLVEEYLSCSPYDIFLALVPSPAPPAIASSPSTSISSSQLFKELAQRIAHITILHWRTWENLVYNNGEFESKKADKIPDLPRHQTGATHEGQALDVVTDCKEPEEIHAFPEMETTGETMATEASAG